MNNKNTTHFTEYTWHAMRQLKKELQSKNSQMRKAMRSFKKNREQK
jgi:S-adenosylmethionine/arginine decarboxylase-like enzyme